MILGLWLIVRYGRFERLGTTDSRSAYMKLYSGLLFLFTCCVCANSNAQSNPFGRLAVTQFSQPYMLLIRDEVVQDDLKLDTHQRIAVRELTDELDVSIWSMRNKSREHVAKTMSDSLAKAKSGMSGILTSKQYQRMDQIVMWTLGMKSFSRDQVAEKLSLTDDQRTTIQELQSATSKSIDDLREQLKSGTSLKSVESKASKLRTEEQRKIFAALSRRQREDFIAMLGRKIDVTKLGHVRFKAPEIVGQNKWLNSPPLTLEKLKGKVVALHFFAFG